MRRLGQHFLQDESTLAKIAGFLKVKPGEVVIEIGAGHGELTKKLLRPEVTVLAIEKDKHLVQTLTKKFHAVFLANPEEISPLPRLAILQGDALQVLPSIVQKLKTQKRGIRYTVVGNIPYYITGRLLRVLSGIEPKPKRIVLLLQEEVAERMTAHPPRMNLLSAVTQSWAEPQIVARVKKDAFSPQPKVNSAVISITPKSDAIVDKEYYQFIHKLFQQPRKTIANNLSAAGYEKNRIIGTMKKMGINPNDRPQNLSLQIMQNIFEMLYTKNEYE